jgi:pyridoxine 4-dehydrogenase
VAMAGLLARSPNVLLIPGATTVAELEAALGAAEVVLGPADVEELDRIADMGGPAPAPDGAPRWGGGGPGGPPPGGGWSEGRPPA